jgi:hypothetical protein
MVCGGKMSLSLILILIKKSLAEKRPLDQKRKKEAASSSVK